MVEAERRRASHWRSQFNFITLCINVLRIQTCVFPPRRLRPVRTESLKIVCVCVRLREVNHKILNILICAGYVPMAPGIELISCRNWANQFSTQPAQLIPSMSLTICVLKHTHYAIMPSAQTHTHTQNNHSYRTPKPTPVAMTRMRRNGRHLDEWLLYCRMLSVCSSNTHTKNIKDWSKCLITEPFHRMCM